MGKMSDKMKQDGAKMRKSKDVPSVLGPPEGDLRIKKGPGCPQDGPKEAPRGPKMAPREPKTAPKWPQDGPR